MAESLTVELPGEALTLLQELAERSGNELQVELKSAVVDRHYSMEKLSDGARIFLESISEDGPVPHQSFPPIAQA